ncbi:hypothetical protein [Bacillus sp. CDB3]|nr:hypothetical protein [Bacillus sp. CDB3]
MHASTDFLLALSTKLQEIADNTSDMETLTELSELIDKINESI